MNAAAATRVPILLAGPASGATLAWRMRGESFLTIIVQATFTLVPDGDMERSQPAGIALAEQHHANLPHKTVRAPSSLVPYRARADVIVVGDARAPGGRSVVAQTVRLTVFREHPLLDKVLLVRGDRGEDGAIRPFERIPIVYERAYGGIGFLDNPFGVGFHGDSDPAPNIVYPDTATVPAGFGAISCHWPARKRLLRRPLRGAAPPFALEVPPDVDWAYFQAAPADQQMDFLCGDEWIVIEGMHPDHPRLASRLPDIRGEARVFGLAGDGGCQAWAVPLRADMLFIDMDALHATVSWRGFMPVRDLEDIGQWTAVAGVAARGRDIEWPALTSTGSGSASCQGRGLERRAEDIDATLVLGGPAARVSAERTALLSWSDTERADRRPVLPFAATAPTPAVPPPAAPLPGAPWSPVPVRPYAATRDLPGTITMAAEPCGEAVSDFPVAQPPDAPLSPSDLLPSEPALPPPPAAEDARARVLRMLQAGEPLDGADLDGADLRSLDFRHISMARATLRGAVLCGCDLSGARLRGARLEGADLTEAILCGAELAEADITGARLARARLERASLERATGDGADLRNALLRGADLRQARLRRALLDAADLSGALAHHADLTEAQLLGADLSRATLRSVTLQRANLARTVLDGADLRDAVLDGANVEGARMATARLRGASTRDLLGQPSRSPDQHELHEQPRPAAPGSPDHHGVYR